MSGPLCARLHPKGAETRRHRQEAQDREMLNAELVSVENDNVLEIGNRLLRNATQSIR